MHLLRFSIVGAFLAPLLLSSAGQVTLSVDRVGDRFGRLVFDEPGDGALWVRGRTYKASFDASGATYYPRFGPKQPENAPLRLSPESVTVGGAPIAFAGLVAPSRSGERVEFDRGAFVEAYELSPGSVEQLFVFPSVPAGGDLVVRIPVPGSLDAFATASGLEFRGELGKVDYSRAVAIDATGMRAIAPTVVEDGAIVIRVDAAFLATAAMPLTIDPVVGTVVIDTTTSDTRSPDVAWCSTEGVWFAVYQETFSATDIDVYVEAYTSSGGFIVLASVDVTGASWTAPRIASLAAAQKFLVVAEVASTTPHGIRGRVVEPNGTIITSGLQFDIAVGGIPNVAPDVGGDPTPTGTSNWCVVYEADFSSTDKQIAYRLVTPSSTLVGPGPTYFAFSGSQLFLPSISKSNAGDEWLVVWAGNGQVTFADIGGARIGRSGNVTAAPFDITGSFAFDFTPCASSPIPGTRRNMVAFVRGLDNGRDIMLAALDGTTVTKSLDLSKAENPSDVVAQIEPSVDCDGEHFLVTYSDFNAAFGFYDARAADVVHAGTSIGVVQPRVGLHPNLGLSQNHSQVSAQHGSSSRRYFAVYDIQQNSTDFDVQGELFDTVAGGTFSAFCFGDGTGTACPCGNSGAAGHGCANSVDPAGALLGAVGTPSTASDTLQLQASGMPTTASCVFIQGESSIAGAVYGDGIRCFSGAFVRLGTKTASGGAASYPNGTEPDISVRGAVPAIGATRTYQVWYRNPPAFCTSATSNVTNGISVAWAP
jgi:hypothetical protein